MRESTLQRRILRELNAVPGCKAIPLTGMEAGTPDLIGCYLGWGFLIECKVDGKLPTLIQDQRIGEWQNTGAPVVVARENFDVYAFLHPFGGDQ